MLALPPAEPLFMSLLPQEQQSFVKYLSNVHKCLTLDREMKGGAVGLDKLSQEGIRRNKPPRALLTANPVLLMMAVIGAHRRTEVRDAIKISLNWETRAGPER